MRVYFFIIAAFVLACCSGGGNRAVGNKGWVIEKIDVTTAPYIADSKEAGLTLSLKIWYRDSFAIEEIISTKTDINAENEVTSKVITEYFRFNDLRKRSIYLYKSFSDTSGCYKQYLFDAGYPIESGWGFNAKRRVEYPEKLIPVKDTVIGTVFYKQMRLTYQEAGKDIYRLYLFRCGDTCYPFTFDDETSAKVGCPLTRKYFMDSTFTKHSLMDEIRIISHELSPTENKVFDAWIKYAKDYPVK